MDIDPEVAILRIGSRQHSVFTLAQALDAGFSESAIKRRVDRGIWIRLHRSVFVPAAVPIAWQQRVMAACLACGPTAVASFDSAAMVWGWASELTFPHVTVLDPTYRQIPRVKIHRSRWLDDTRHQRFVVTNPMRTLLDLADDRPAKVVERNLDDAHRRGLIRMDRMEQFLALPRNRRAPGSKLLRELVAMRDQTRPLGSILETDFFALLREFHLPLPVPQYPVMTRRGQRYIDFAYPDARLAIELDGFEKHGLDRGVFVDERVRQNEVEELGFHFRRFTWEQIQLDQIHVAVTVGVGLGLRPRGWIAG